MKNSPTNRLVSLVACSLLFVTQSCATVFNSGSQSVIANASGDKEDIKIEISTPNGSYRSHLPTTIVTNPSSFHPTKVIVKDKCYEQTEIEVGKSITPSFWVNFLWGSVFPVAMGIDYLDGTMWKMNNQTIVPLNSKKC